MDRKALVGMQPTTAVPIVAIMSSVSVGHGGVVLPGFRTGEGALGDPSSNSVKKAGVYGATALRLYVHLGGCSRNL